MLSSALKLVKLGWMIFPLAPGDKVPPREWRWKQPGYQTTDADQVRRKWAELPYNIGVACGPSRLVVVDLDLPKTGEAPPPEWAMPGVNDGEDAFAVLCQRAGNPLPFETLQVRSRRGGLHLYFAAPEGVSLGPSSGKLGWKIDVRAGASYIVGPGSYVDQPDGSGPYVPTHDVPPAPLPDFLVKLLAPAPPKRRGYQAPVRLTSCNDRTTAYGETALANEIQRVLDASEGTRNTVLNEAAFALGQLVGGRVLPEHTVDAALHAAAERIGLAYREAEATIRSGMNGGARQPRVIS
jgi:hypothetical protein